MYFVCIQLLQFVSQDLSVLSMSVMGFKKKLDGLVGGMSSIHLFLCVVFGIF